ncbi:MAG: PhoH family protein [Planctomycetes bacterium]|nr:PhoH family protein [Planctomycetota bacterium]
MNEATIPLVEPDLVLSLFGPRDQHVRKIRDVFGVNVTHRNGPVHVSGEEDAVVRATTALERLKSLVQRQRELVPDQVDEVLSLLRSNAPAHEPAAVEVIYGGRRIAPRSPGQARYIEAIRKNEMVFAVGPAGTGKTYLAVALAVEALKNRAIRKIVLVRPAVEAGERLGFLPGDLQAKINPYLRPLLDALHEMIDHDQIKRLMEQDVIEVIPLAYMRGRTLNEAFIILDEAQNTTVAQMKMFLTRMGAGSRIVVSGDHTQVDLPHDARSGLTDALSRLKSIKGIKAIRLTGEDIVRHRLVQDIVQAYEEGPRRRRGGT